MFLADAVGFFCPENRSEATTAYNISCVYYMEMWWQVTKCFRETISLGQRINKNKT